MNSGFNPPLCSEELKVSFPADHVLLLTFNRPKSLNAMTPQMARDLGNVFDWFQDDPRLWVVIITGAGRIFCAGADLKAWNDDQQRGKTDEQASVAASPYGFGSISRRSTCSKPIIAAVNGGAYGGGLELIMNCDIVIAGRDAKFAFPEVRRGVVAIEGGIPRISQVAGHQHASELLLLGNTISAEEAQTRFRFVNRVVPTSEVLSTAILVAKQIVQNSPDAVQSTKKALLLSRQRNSEQTVLEHVWTPETMRVFKGDNIKEGLKAFAEKRHPIWKNPAKL